MRGLLKAKYFIPFIVILVFVTAAIRHRIAIGDLKENGIFVNATIIDYLGSTKGGSGKNPSFKCRFSYKGQLQNLISSSSVKEKAFSYIGKNYPALYSERTNTLRLLITPEDFTQFGCKFPDSLMQE